MGARRGMMALRHGLLALLLFVPPVLAAAEPVTVRNLRMWPAPDHTTVVLDLSAPLEHKLFTLAEPDRVVIDLDNARLGDSVSTSAVSGDIVAGVRSADQGGNVLRIVLDLKREVRPRSFVLRPAGQYGHRLVIELYDPVVAEAQPEAGPPTVAPAEPAPTVSGDLVVAIDAGHGGEDPGAIGRRYRTREKDVTLAIARELYHLLKAAPGIRPVMVRDGDYYIKLGERTRKAKRYGADVFVSIHADSLPGARNQARGSSVYALSERGATSRIANDLADSENASDWLGGVSPDDVDGDVGRVLSDLTKTATIADSLDLGADVLVALRSVGPVHYTSVGQAGFAVLKSPVPSVLIETAFISNPDEERKLRDPAHQRRIAQGIYNGLQRALPRLIAKRGPGPRQAVTVAAGQGGAAREHIVRPGDTLATIARQYDIHVDALRFINNLSDSTVRVGTRLRIPPRDGG